MAASDLRAAVDAMAGELGGHARRDQPFGSLTTYRVGGPAALLVTVGTEADLLALRQSLRGRDLPVVVVGKGSNMLVADAGFPGVAVRLGAEFEALSTRAGADPGPDGEDVVVRAGGALGLPVLARRTVEAGLTGLEWAVGVPGSVGGGVRMNAGGHGSDVAASLVRYRWVDLWSEDGGVDGPERLALGYRASSLTPSQVVVWAEFSVRRGPADEGRAAIAAIVRWRRANQPGGSNAGSVFANPPDDSAGRLVEAAGMKGVRLGSARVSDKHANFIIADDGGSADDVHDLIERVRDAVARRCGVLLRGEVCLVGFGNEARGGVDLS
jgi:UDP-N-acetylmuramate dehydrogenase